MINKNIIFNLDGLAGVISRPNVNHLNGMKSLTVIALCLLLWCCSKAPEKYSDLTPAWRPSKIAFLWAT